MAESLYLHVPFCKSICFYCDFNRTLYNEDNANQWLCCLENEIHSKHIRKDLKTIYIGGGTPTSLSLLQLEKLLILLNPYSSKVKEYTVESNIESLSREKIQLLKKYNVNRISLGVQSLQDFLLKDMNRKHKKEDVFKKIEEIYKEGITNISVDLIYGFENQTIDMWEQDLMELMCCKYISHVSLYSLTIEEKSVFGRQNRKTVENEMEAQMYDLAIHILERNGFKQYEVANFSKPNKESLHNQCYWEYDDFYGVGIGASGKEGCIRYDNIGNVMDYLKGKYEINEEFLTEEDLIFENIMMSLRMRKGLDLQKFENRYGKDIQLLYKDTIDEEISAGNLILENGHLKTTKKGMFYLHDILVKFMR